MDLSGKLLWILTVPLLILAGAAVESYLPATKYFDRFPVDRSVSLEDVDVLRFLDLGVGSSAVFRTKEGHQIIIDTGEDSSALLLQEDLRLIGADKIDHIILTTAKPEHMGGLGILTQTYPIGRILYPELSGREFQLETYEAAKLIPRVNLQADEEYQLGNGISLRVFYPRMPIYETFQDGTLVMQINYKGTRILFTGDLTKEAMDCLLDLPLESEILVVPNHARPGSLTNAFLKKVNPRVAIITGVKKGTLPPDENLVEQLAESWIDTYRTDQHGTVTVVFSNKSYEIMGP